MNDVEPTSQLAGLLDKRDQLAAAEQLRLRIPRWDDPEIVITYKLLDQADYAAAMSVIYDSTSRKAEEIAEISMDSNTDILVKAFKSIEFRGSELKTSFGATDELADGLGLTGQDRTARNAVRRLFVGDADLLAHSRRVVEWSGYSNQKVDEGFSGE